MCSSASVDASVVISGVPDNEDAVCNCDSVVGVKFSVFVEPLESGIRITISHTSQGYFVSYVEIPTALFDFQI